MKRLLIASILSVAAFQSTAGEAGLCAIMQPCVTPAQYRSGPFLAEPVVREVTLRQVQVACGVGSAHAFRAASGFPFSVFGCSKLQGSHCIVHVPKDVKPISATLYREILEHELAHCRGWVHARY
jgi:hypothetical protein